MSAVTAAFLAGSVVGALIAIAVLAAVAIHLARTDRAEDPYPEGYGPDWERG